MTRPLVVIAAVADNGVIGGDNRLLWRLHLTFVHAEPDGDARFPAFDRRAFREVWREDHPAGPDDEHSFTFIDYVR